MYLFFNFDKRLPLSSCKLPSPSCLHLSFRAPEISDIFMWQTPAISILEFFVNNKLAGRNHSKAIIIIINFYYQFQSSMHSAVAREEAGGARAP